MSTKHLYLDTSLYLILTAILKVGNNTGSILSRRLSCTRLSQAPHTARGTPTAQAFPLHPSSRTLVSKVLVPISEAGGLSQVFGHAVPSAWNTLSLFFIRKTYPRCWNLNLNIFGFSVFLSHTKCFRSSGFCSPWLILRGQWLLYHIPAV